MAQDLNESGLKLSNLPGFLCKSDRPTNWFGVFGWTVWMRVQLKRCRPGLAAGTSGCGAPNRNWTILLEKKSGRFI